MFNVFERFRRLLPDAPLQVGTVLDVADGVATLEMPGGGRIRARGAVAQGQRVFVRGGLIEGPAPALPVEVIEI